MLFDFCSLFVGLTPGPINRQFIGSSWNSLFRAWLGVGSHGAAAASGTRPDPALPDIALKAYHELARRHLAAGKNGVQQARLGLVEQELFRRGVKP